MSNTSKHIFPFSWQKVILLLLSTFYVTLAAQAQNQIVGQEAFGKNRIQYKSFNWQFYSTQNFNVYFYSGGKQAAIYTAEYAEKELKRITSIIGYYPYSKTTLILYNSIADLRQSNIGLNDDRYQTGGETMFLKNKVELAFDGTQTRFKKNISYNITMLLLNDMMYGGSLKEVLQSSYLLKLPDWFITGAATYITEGWNVDMDNYMRDMVTKTKNKKPEALFVRNQQLAGQSVWNYITERYGYTSIQNILNLTRITRDVEIGISSSLNIPYRRFVRDWSNYYLQMNSITSTRLNPVDANRQLFKKNRKDNVYSEPVFTPNGTKLAYVENDRGQYEIKLYDIAKRRVRTIRKGGYKTPDQQIDTKMPLLAWKSNTQLGIAEVKRGVITLSSYYLDRRNFSISKMIKSILGKPEGTLNQFTQILDMDYSDDGKMLVMSAVRDGKSDIFLYRGRKAEQITNDLYDDRNAVFMKGNQGLIFSSNRFLDSTGSVVPQFDKIVNNFDIYYYDLNKQGFAFKQLTRSISNESNPRPLDEQSFLYLGEESGVRSLYRYNLASGQNERVSAFLQNIKSFDFNPNNNNLTLIAADRDRDFVYMFPGFSFQTNPEFKTVRQQTLEQRSIRPAATVNKEATQPTQPAAPIDTAQKTTTDTKEIAKDKAVDTRNYEFETDQQKPARPRSITGARSAQSQIQTTEAVQLAGPVQYDLRFSINKLITSVYQDPLMGFGIVAEVGMSDMFEDHRIRGGVFLLTDLRSSNFYAEYSNLKHRYDLRVSYQKQSIFTSYQTKDLRYGRHEFTPALIYPLTHSLSVRLLPKFVHTKYAVTNVLAEADSVMDFAGGGAEVVFDNSVTMGVNMYEGTRMKAGIMTLRGLDNKRDGFNKFYLDLRHYQKVHRQIVFANRLTYGHYFGQSPNRFILGGMDNWLFSSYDDNGPSIYNGTPPRPAELFFLQFATNMRGFKYNARNGTSALLLNSELRIPIIQYLFKDSPIGSGFFRNLQFTGFTDIGSAYTGVSPFNRKNSYNTQVLGGNQGEFNTNPFQATVVNYRNPFLFGYGAGVRTTLLGVYGKADIAWGKENFKDTGPIIYLTLGYDF
ncbi:TolB-like translocation protein [Adhaeribacter radiodurans]|uniref:PD40 domain-containing protein n=1 Tax=Adhaeribacter radiodurans TaxID=2745197 RepID=A0A7L7LBR6_9BACT|nr:hypothetical protein [Adhaeribacter radiodurans]QMU30187.1 hypothetical protein HUW48_20080 [Adhaeribacter radiodurans]